MLDQSLEQKLRAALRAEGDELSFTITAEELERRLALRRRGSLSPLASLGLAAAVGVGLLGLVGVVGGWFDPRPAVVPVPSPVAVASVAPSDAASPSPAPLLPSIDELLDPLDPATIVRAQAVGPAAGPTGGPLDAGSRGVGFGPVTVAGSYRAWTACLGDDQLQLLVLHPGTIKAEQLIPITCDGSVTSRQLGLETGDFVGVRSGAAISWRFILEAPQRDPLHATEIAILRAPPDQDDLLSVHGESSTPDYGPSGTGGGLWLPAEGGAIAQRPGYRVLVTCAGPGPIRYAFAPVVDRENPPATPPEPYAETQVDCDGQAHNDELGLPLSDGARLVVTSSSQIAWSIIVTSDKPPIALAPDGDGWTMSGATGPGYFPAGQPLGLTVPATDGGGDVRVVISCAGDGRIDGTIDTRDVPDGPIHPFTLDCNVEHTDAVTLVRTYPRAGSYATVQFDPHGKAIWFAMTVQVRGPASPAP